MNVQVKEASMLEQIHRRIYSIYIYIQVKSYPLCLPYSGHVLSCPKKQTEYKQQQFIYSDYILTSPMRVCVSESVCVCVCVSTKSKKHSYAFNIAAALV